ncbi:putative transposase [Trichonephila clavipes]|uniref:Putative transposase n=1 Tax=Trichonephila clavipes TaxID=2585209 RepID=A0A8X6W0A4_TRICX|nr:putative transposase [Trichonephila clavipes]
MIQNYEVRSYSSRSALFYDVNITLTQSPKYHKLEPPHVENRNYNNYLMKAALQQLNPCCYNHDFLCYSYPVLQSPAINNMFNYLCVSRSISSTKKYSDFDGYQGGISKRGLMHSLTCDCSFANPFCCHFAISAFALISTVICVHFVLFIHLEYSSRSTNDSVCNSAELGGEKDLRQNDSEKPLSGNRFLASKNIPVAPQPPYSPDLSPCDFFLFPKLKNSLKVHHFGTLENIQTTVTDQLKAIPIFEFHQCYEEWKKRLQRCVASEGSYFEGDNVEL